MSSKRNSSGDRIQDLRADWKHPTEIRFGAGRASELPDACESLGIRRALLVTDPGLARLPIRGRLVGGKCVPGHRDDCLFFRSLGPRRGKHQGRGPRLSGGRL